jgi:hypothetical protein
MEAHQVTPIAPSGVTQGQIGAPGGLIAARSLPSEDSFGRAQIDCVLDNSRPPETMVFEKITKPREWTVVPNLRDYRLAREDFSWEAAHRMLDGLPGGKGLNLAYQTV